MRSQTLCKIQNTNNSNVKNMRIILGLSKSNLKQTFFLRYTFISLFDSISKILNFETLYARGG